MEILDNWEKWKVPNYHFTQLPSEVIQMNRYVFSIIAFVLLLMSFIVETPAQYYYPNFVGNMWTLRSPETSEETVVTIAETAFISGQEVNVLERRTQHGEPDKMYLITERDGLKMARSIVNNGLLGVLIFDYDPPEEFLPIPLEVGAAWEITQDTKIQDFKIQMTINASVLAKEDVTVPAGTFRNCLKIRQEYSIKAILNISLEMYMWLAPNIGLVKEVNSSGVVFELVDYKLFYPWDVNHDFRVDLLDVKAVAAYFGEYLTSAPANNPDVNGDGLVDIIDLVLVGIHFGETYRP